MESITDLFRSIKERISNPLLNSFLLSWLFWNWKIPLAVFFNNDSFESLLEFISSNSTYRQGLWLPLLSAIAYTFVFPVIRNLVNAYNVFSIKWGNDLSFRISEEIPVAFQKLIDKENEVSVEKLKLSESMAEYNQTKLDLSSVTSERDKLRESNEKLNREKQEIVEEIFDASLLEGTWTVIRTVSGEMEESEEITFQGNQYYTSTGSEARLKKGYISHFYYMSGGERIFFLKAPYTKNSTNPYIVNELNVKSNGRVLEGTEGTYRIVYSKNRNHRKLSVKGTPIDIVEESTDAG